MGMPLDDNLMKTLEALRPESTGTAAAGLFKPYPSCPCTGGCGGECRGSCKYSCSGSRRTGCSGKSG